MKKLIIYCLLSTFLGSTIPAWSNQVLDLPILGSNFALSSNIPMPRIKGFKIDPNNPFNLDFVIEHGKDRLNDEQITEEAKKMIRYFLAVLTIPQGDLWVNLSPYEKQRITTNEVGVTALGRDMLAQDYLLKQLAASLTHPDKELGKKFWQEFYLKAAAYGNTKIPVNVFNKVWIVPDEASVYEKNNIVLIVKSRLKVMMEEDYLATRKNQHAGTTNQIKSDWNELKKELLPVIEHEINEGKNFALIRQIYDAFILAVWYKRNLKASILNEIYSNQKKMVGIDIEDKQIKEKIYQQYLQAFKKGVYNFVKEDRDPLSHQLIPRKYFSGGVDLSRAMIVEKVESLPMDINKGKFSNVLFRLDRTYANAAMTASMPKLMSSMKQLLEMMREEVEDYEKEVDKDEQARKLLIDAFKHYVVKEGSAFVEMDVAFKRALDETLDKISEGSVLYFNIQKPLQDLVEDFQNQINRLSQEKASIANKNKIRYLSNFIVRIQVVLETIKLVTAHRRLIRTLESRQYWGSIVEEKENSLLEAVASRQKRIGGLTAAIDRANGQREGLQAQRQARIANDPSLKRIARFLLNIMSSLRRQKITEKDMAEQLANHDKRINADLIPQIEALDRQIMDLTQQKSGLDEQVKIAREALEETENNVSSNLSVVDRIKRARQLVRDANILDLEAGLDRLEKIEQEETYFISTADMYSLGDIGAAIKRRREQLGYGLKELSVFLGLGVAYQRLVSLESGNGFLSPQQHVSEDIPLILNYLADALGIDFDSLHAAVLKFAYLEEMPDDVVDMRHLGEFFKHRRKLLGISREDMEVSLSSINNYEAGRALPSQGVGRGNRGINYLRIMADKLRIDYEALQARVEAIQDGLALNQAGGTVESLITKESVRVIITESKYENLHFETLVSDLMARYGLPDSQRFHVMQRLRSLNLSNDEKIRKVRDLEDQLEILADMITDILAQIPLSDFNKLKSAMLKKIEELMGDDVDMERMEEFLALLGYKDDADFQRMKELVDEFGREKVKLLVSQLPADAEDLVDQVVMHIVDQTGIDKEKVRHYLAERLRLKSRQDFVDLLPSRLKEKKREKGDKGGQTLGKEIVVPVEFRGLSDSQRRSLLVNMLNEQLSALEPSFVKKVGGLAHLKRIIDTNSFTDTLNKDANVILEEARTAGADTGKGYQGQMHRDENDLNRRLALYVFYIVKADYGDSQIRDLFSLVFPDIIFFSLGDQLAKAAVFISPEKKSYLEALLNILPRDDFKRLEFPTVVSADTIHMANQKLSTSQRKAFVTQFILLRDNTEFRTRGRSVTQEEFSVFKKEKGIDRAQTTGGIDLNEDLLIIDSQGKNLPIVSLSTNEIQVGQFSGLNPVIVNIRPITSLIKYAEGAVNNSYINK